MTKISLDFFPLIAFLNDGSAVILKKSSEPENILVVNVDGKPKPTQTKLKEFAQDMILAKELNEEKRKSGAAIGFSALSRKIIGYTPSHGCCNGVKFSLTTALFTMTVYDRIIPNGF